MDSNQQKLTRKLKRDECLEFKLTGVHSVTHIPCHICNRQLTSFFAVEKNFVCQNQECIELGECVCGQKEMQDLIAEENIEIGESDDLILS